MLKKSEAEDIYPLSPMQQGILFDTLRNQESSLYIAQSVWELAGELNEPCLEAAFQRVISRHAILRTAFVWGHIDRLLQIVARTAKLSFCVHDWRNVDPEEVNLRLRSYMEEDRNRGFDLSAPPLMRVALFRTAVGSYKIIITSHHIILDGWAGSSVFNEVIACYISLVQGEPYRAPSRPPYREYISWLQKHDTDAARSFWSEM